MALVKHNNNSISDITTPGSLAQGKMTLISEQTASGSASISFTSGIDSTYPIYRFEFINMHPSNDQSDLQFNMSTDSGSNYNVTKTSSFFKAQHNEDDAVTDLSYDEGGDLAQGTGYQNLTTNTGSDNDQSCSGTLYLYNPSSTTFVKHFIAIFNNLADNDRCRNSYVGGYGNTTSVINAISFKFDIGNIDSGTIKLYGIKGD